MTQIPERICIFCKYFYMVTGQPDYSDWTPGNEMEIGCIKGYWAVDNYVDDEVSYRDKLLTAGDCDNWEIIDGYEEKKS